VSAVVGNLVSRALERRYGDRDRKIFGSTPFSSRWYVLW